MGCGKISEKKVRRVAILNGTIRPRFIMITFLNDPKRAIQIYDVSTGTMENAIFLAKPQKVYFNFCSHQLFVTAN